MWPAGLLLSIRQSVIPNVDTQPQPGTAKCSVSHMVRLGKAVRAPPSQWDGSLVGLALVSALKGTGLCTRCLTASKRFRKERTIPDSKSKRSF